MKQKRVHTAILQFLQRGFFLSELQRHSIPKTWQKQSSEGQSSEGQTSEGQSSEGQSPEGQSPEGQAPEKGSTGSAR